METSLNSFDQKSEPSIMPTPYTENNSHSCLSPLFLEREHGIKCHPNSHRKSSGLEGNDTQLIGPTVEH